MGIISNRILIVLIFGEMTPMLVAGQVYVNQVGYLPLASKQLFVSQAADSFMVVNAANHQVVFQEKLQPFIASDPATELDLFLGDLSDVHEPGNYFAIIPGGDSSAVFKIADNVYKAVYQKSLKSFYYQRCGMQLLEEWAGEFTHPICHANDGHYHSTTGLSGAFSATGGWHDAGDYGKYIVNAGITVGALLMAYEYFPEKFNHDNLQIPESGNAIPDILDEVRYELEWMLKMQNDDGGVFHKLTRENFSGFVMPQNDNANRYIYQISSTATGDFAAVMARAARVFKDFDSKLAQDCLEASETAWDFLEAHTSIVPAGGFSNPTGTYTGEYGDGNDNDERIWAASELFETTGRTVYRDYYHNNYTTVSLFDSYLGWQNVAAMAHFTYLFGTQQNSSQTIKTILRQNLINNCTDYLQKSNNNGFYVLLDPGEFWWGSNSTALNNAIFLVMCYELTSQPDFRQTALNQLHYVLGANAHDMSFVTGLGNVYPMHPHHRPSAADGILEPVPGLIAGGPNEYLNDPALQNYFNTSTPPALCYIDDVGSYSSNENAINWNAPLVFLSGYFANQLSSLEPPLNDKQIPKGINLLPNYPNPFNGTTTLQFKLQQTENITLQIFDVTGAPVYRKGLGSLSSGSNTFVWEPQNVNGESLSSGIYYYYLRGTGKSTVRKMVYLK